MTITMIPFDKGGYSMRSCFALAIYASILKKKKSFLSFCQNPGGGGRYSIIMLVMGYMGVAPPKRDTFFILQVSERVV